ncbi:hypothetical protein [Roseovarius sp.]|uniref:hypothetical protein n=1 Tax=Roseovarius sp. TaxID=1486281 RepID=UPI003BAB72D9
MTEQIHQGQNPLPYTDQIASLAGKKLLVIAAQIVGWTETIPPPIPRLFTPTGTVPANGRKALPLWAGSCRLTWRRDAIVDRFIEASINRF